jgi:hypothetical protein
MLLIFCDNESARTRGRIRLYCGDAQSGTRAVAALDFQSSTLTDLQTNVRDESTHDGCASCVFTGHKLEAAPRFELGNDAFAEEQEEGE